MPDKYNSRSARAHIKRVVDILENPCVLSNHSQVSKKQKEKDKTRSRTYSSSSTGMNEESKAKEETEHDFEKEMKEMIMKRNMDYQEIVLEHQKD